MEYVFIFSRLLEQILVIKKGMEVDTWFWWMTHKDLPPFDHEKLQTNLGKCCNPSWETFAFFDSTG